MSSRRKIAMIVIITAVVATMLTSFTIPMLMSSGSSLPVPAHPTANVSGQGAASAITLYGQNGAKSLAELFQNIKSMSVEFNFTSASGNGSVSTSSDRISYVVGTTFMDDGRMAYKVNLTDTALNGNGLDTESALVWVDHASGSILQVSMEGEYWTGADAQKESGVFSMITTNCWLSLLNSSTVAPSVASHSVNLGSTKLYATTYEGLSSFTQFQNLAIVVGSFASNGMQLVLSSTYSVPGNGIASFRILSLATS